MKVGVSRFLPIFFAVAGVGLVSVFAWTELPVADDPNVFMPGSQPGSVNLESVNRCDNCHGGYNPAIEPAHNWRGSMMAHAARDPLWMACLTVALQDSIWAVGNANAGDLCIRCHTPGGWLGGRSDPPNTTALSAGAGDFEGVSCDACHRMVDPFNALRQAPELPAETDATAALEAEATYELDRAMLEQLVLFSGPPFFDPASRLPTFFGDGLLPGYIESTSGQYFIDPYNTKRGPRFDAEPKHRWSYSRFHKSKYLCATCHDVSNPVLANLTDPGSPERQAAASYFHVERTFSEFMLSAYGQPGGSETRGGVADSGVAWAAKCQDCHMRDVTGTAANKRGILTRPDLALHDLTGGNTWISGILASADPASIAYDPYNHAILSGAKYAAARVDVDGLQGHGNALLDGRERAFQQLELAADLAVVSDTDTELVLQILNNTGHKLISGFPEGRRMWLNVKFYDEQGSLVDEINPYDPLVIGRDAAGNAVYVSGGILQETHPALVYEAKMSGTDLTGEPKTFHFVLATERYKDNRIPPKGFDIAGAEARLVVPRWQGVKDAGYFTAAEYQGGYDEVTIVKPTGASGWSAELYYQTTSKEYIEFLRDEINGTASTLSSPTPSGEPEAYIVQADPYFATLKDWGHAIYDLWLHNEGCPPVRMTGLVVGGPCLAPATPPNLVATAGRRDIRLGWDAVEEADEYRVYYDQGGKYAFLATTESNSYTDGSVTAGQTYCYAVTAVEICDDGSEGESAPSAAACGTVSTNTKGGGGGKGNK